MRKTHLRMALAMTCLLAACSPASQKGQAEGQIDILPAFENQTELKVSHLGKNIRYVPLETTDSSLIGASCKVKLLEDKVMVLTGTQTETHCFLFDKETGKFIREVGHKGQDPRGYSELKAYVHPVTGNIYFHRAPNKLIKYSQEGEFLGEVEMPNGLSSGFYPLLTKDGMLVYEGEAFNAQQQTQLYYLDETKGKTGDVALRNIQESVTLNVEGIASLTVGSLQQYGLLGYHGAIMVGFKSGMQGLYAINYPALWQIGDEYGFQEVLGDTIYRVKGLELEPRFFFHLGERRLPEEERGKKEGNEDKLTITYVLETGDLVYFQCAKNLYGSPTIYNGLYQKSDGTVMMAPVADAFADDLTGFLPFSPMTHTREGAFVGVLTIEDIQEWQEEHPDVKLEGALAPLRDLADDANPVVVIVEP